MKTISLMFAGQGAQAPGMGKNLYETNAAARAIFDEADDVLNRPISRLCFEGPESELTACANCQPAIYTMSFACLAAWREKQQEETADGAATAVLLCGGLSLGELTACAAAGVFSFADGLRLVAKRGELMDECCRQTAGGMAAVLGGDAAVVSEACKNHDIDVANLNCPGQIVISGERNRLTAAMNVLEGMEIRVVPLTVAGAYHSRLMRPAGDSLGQFLREFTLMSPRMPVVQNVVGAPVTDTEEIRRNLEKQVYSSVRWEDCVRVMMAQSDSLVEFGPGTVLSGFVKRIQRGFPCQTVNG